MVSWRGMAVNTTGPTAGEPLRTVDRLLIGYQAAVILIAITRLDRRPDAPWAIAGAVLFIGLVLLLHRPGLGRLAAVTREVYPVILLPVLYAALDFLNGPDARTWDGLVRQWEAALFGGQVSQTWWQQSPSAAWSTVLHATYFSYYFIVPLPVLLFLWQGRRELARSAATLIVATFLLHYLVFLLLPVAGPYYEFPRPTGPFVDNWAARLVYDVLEGGSSYGAAFPSSHVAATFAATIAAWRGNRRLGMVLLIPTGMMAVGVVYTQMHYAVDALAGLLVPLPVAWAVARAEQRKGPA